MKSTVDIGTQLGRGLYLPAEAARLTGLDDDRVRRWVRGYDFKARSGERRQSGPLFRREHHGERLLLTFLDLIEVCFVREFIRHGVTLQIIRLVQKEAAEEFGVAHPFCVKQFETDGQTIVERRRERRRPTYAQRCQRRQLIRDCAVAHGHLLSRRGRYLVLFAPGREG